ncbi:MAG: hypothetical protein EOR04_11485 [Mesorhizobium sp.]|uniref:hypothetical protein n=1 Tax=Mesorhizobium sp. TaxID=1871066 RepID=UPI000FE5BAED|nr:hypothetical protein [Mesorhizobium sp.]RWP42431.1 MAG: hypothetical protein EOR04_11485 [Mesorhizobium sp.]
MLYLYRLRFPNVVALLYCVALGGASSDQVLAAAMPANTSVLYSPSSKVLKQAAEVKRLQAEFQQHEQTVATLSQQLAAIEGRAGSLAETLTVGEDELRSEATILSREISEKSSLEHSLSRLSNDVSQARTQISSKESNKSSAEGQLSRIESDARGAEQRVRDASQRISHFQVQKTSSASQRQSRESELNQIRSTISHLSSSSSSSEISRLESELSTSQSLSRGYESDINSLSICPNTEACNDAAGEISSLRSNQQNEQSKQSQLSSRISQMKSAEQSALSELQSARGRENSLQSDIQRAQSEENGYERELRSAEGEKSNAESQQRQLESSSQDQRRQIDQLRSELNSLGQGLQRAESDVGSIQSQIRSNGISIELSNSRKRTKEQAVSLTLSDTAKAVLEKELLTASLNEYRKKQAELKKILDEQNHLLVVLKFDETFEVINKELDNAKTDEDTLRIALAWDEARQPLLGLGITMPESELEEFKEASSDELAKDPVKEKVRDGALWQIGRVVAKRFPNLAINGAIILEAVGRVAVRVSRVDIVLRALQPSIVANEDQVRLGMDATMRNRIAVKFARTIPSSALRLVVPAPQGPVIRSRP